MNTQDQRFREIQRRLDTLDTERKRLMEELFIMCGVHTDTATRKTSRNRLTPEQARRLCMQAAR